MASKQIAEALERLRQEPFSPHHEKGQDEAPLAKALKILTDHQKWRTGCNETPATAPHELTAAIDYAIMNLQDSLETAEHVNKSAKS